jgi:uncharacterized membrane protein
MSPVAGPPLIGYRMMGFIRLIYSFLRKNFLTGFFVAVPFALTIGFMIWLWVQIDEPLQQIFNVAGKREGMPWYRMYIAIDKSEAKDFIVPILGLCILLFAILVLGIIVRSIIGRMALGGLENIVARLPIVGMLYMSLKQLGEAFITTDGKTKFQRAVAVQFPYKGVWAIGFVTGKGAQFMPTPPGEPGMDRKVVLTVFVPTTPLPTQGFMLVVPEDETLELDMSVQDALKLVVSGGMISPHESHRQRAQSEMTKAVLRQTNASIALKPERGAAEP